MSKLAILIISIVIMPFNCSEKKFNEKLYLKRNFDVHISSDTRITYHSKSDVVEKLKLDGMLTDQEILEQADRMWTSGMEYFIDSVFTYDEHENLHGVFINFFGDSNAGYIQEFYLHGKKDSIRIHMYTSGEKRIERYKNGKPHGVWEYIRKDNSKGFIKKFKRGVIIDTSFSWWPNGELMEFEVFKNGKTTTHKCFDRDGKTEIECEKG